GNSCFHVRIYASKYACEITYSTDDHRLPNVAVNNEDEEEEGAGDRIQTTVANSFEKLCKRADQRRGPSKLQ
ncbi:hypothetical protein LINGRAHAP2_LOCUS9876, partial [Linum grandiflorum]